MNHYNQNLIEALKASLKDEEEAIGSYYMLAEKAPNKEYRRVILGIRKDEMGHALKTRKFLTYLTCEMYSGDVNYKEGKDEDFYSGIKSAITDEEGAPVAYKKIMDMSKYYPEIFYGIAETRKDELTHALLLKSILD
jgi:rubrerythrin